MKQASSRALHLFRNEVGIRFQLYNSLFTSLPFHRIEKTGILLSLLSNNCEEGYKRGQSPIKIVDDFFQNILLILMKKRKRICYSVLFNM
ncbi:MAG: hypothetical protein NVV59_05595 [Chitinophagaceae bacterium]|nr:hypothetical protein [Chitinophagaceae bacterium]